MKRKLENFDSYILRLRYDGVKEIDRGFYSTVFHHPTNEKVAVKIVTGDTAFLEYAEFCKRNPNNPYLLKIYDIVKVKVDMGGSDYCPDYIHFVFMEKLIPVDFSLPSNYNAVDSFTNLIDIYDLDIDLDYEKPLSTDEFWHALSKISYNKDAKHARQLAKFLIKSRHDLDIHDENYMLRKVRNKMQLVFTDPLQPG